MGLVLLVFSVIASAAVGAVYLGPAVQAIVGAPSGETSTYRAICGAASALIATIVILLILPRFRSNPHP